MAQKEMIDDDVDTDIFAIIDAVWTTKIIPFRAANFLCKDELTLISIDKVGCRRSYIYPDDDDDGGGDDSDDDDDDGGPDTTVSGIVFVMMRWLEQ